MRERNLTGKKEKKKGGGRKKRKALTKLTANCPSAQEILSFY